MEIKEVVREKYGQAALRVATGGSSCCGSVALSNGGCDPVTSNLYTASETSELPADAVKASLGCGNPTALAQLNPGETVLDLGSGGGIDVLLSAKRVGPAGKVYGHVPEQVRHSMELWVGCIAGALEEKDYVNKLVSAGFTGIDIEPTRVYSVDDARHFLSGEGIDVDAISKQVEGKFMGAFIRAGKPSPITSSPEACCGPTCCS